MKKLIKIAAYLAVAAVVLLGAAAVALKIFLPPEKAKALIIAQGEKALHRKVELQDVSLGLFSGLRAAGLKVSEPADFSAGTFLTADALVVRVELLPLLHKQVVVREVALEGLQASLILKKDGKFNFQDLMTPPPAGAASGAPPTAVPAAGSAALPVALLVDVIRFTGGLTYEDRVAKAKTEVKDLSASIKGLKLAGAFPVEAKATILYKAGPASYEASLGAAGELDLANLDMDALNGRFKKLEADVRGLKVTGEASFKGAVKNEVEGSLKVPALDSALLRKASGAPVPDGLNVPPSSLSFKLLFSSPTLDVGSFTFELAGLKAQGRLKVPNVFAKEPSLSLSLESNSFPLGPLAEIAEAGKAFGVQGKAKLTAKVSGTAAKPKAEGSLELDGVGSTYMKQKVEAFAGSVRFTEDSVEIPSLTGRLNGGDLKLKLSARNFAAPVVEAEGSLSVLDAGALMALVPATPAAPAAAPPPPPPPPYKGPILKTSGKFTVAKIVHPNFNGADMEASWDLSGVTPELKLMDGKAAFRLGAGKATDMLKLMDQHKGMKAMLYPLVAIDKARGLKVPGLKLPDVNNLAYTKVQGDYIFKKGVMSMQPFLLDSPDLYAETRGDVDLPGQKTDLKMKTKSSVGSVNLNVKGPLASPSVTPDVSKIVDQAAGELKKQLGNGKAADLLKGLFK